MKKVKISLQVEFNFKLSKHPMFLTSSFNQLISKMGEILFSFFYLKLIKKIHAKLTMYCINFILHFGHNLTILLNWGILGNILKKEIWEKVTLARLVHENLHFPGDPFVLYLHTWLLIINSWPVNIWQGLSSNLHNLHLRLFVFCSLKPVECVLLCVRTCTWERKRYKGCSDSEDGDLMTQQNDHKPFLTQGWTSCFFFSIHFSRFIL